MSVKFIKTNFSMRKIICSSTGFNAVGSVAPTTKPLSEFPKTPKRLDRCDRKAYYGKKEEPPKGGFFLRKKLA